MSSTARGARIASFLGMPQGTANARLRKALFFKYIQKAEEDRCFKCGKIIKTVNELSIEHKLPWEGISQELFWDLDNIAFSHLICNRPHRYRTPDITRPEGKEWCSIGKHFEDIELFSKHNKRKNGLQPHCKPCNSKWRQKKNMRIVA